MIRTALSDFVTLIFPQVCLACEESLARGEDHICTGCRAQFPYTDYHKLPPSENPLARKFWGKLPVRYSLSYLRFLRRGRVQHLLHQLKYQGQRDIGRVLGRWYGAELADHGLATDFDLIVPVPLHPRKLAKRGYNQSDTFAEGLSLSLEVPWSAATLQRTEYTTSQTQKNRAERWQNVAEVFEVAKPADVADKRILLVDDVLTTGATLEACAAALLAAGCREVSIATIACAEN
ncbi:amidophosphoribosyltransferase [Hymenobacter qilianensis]|uniref:ComF family protein n=2 Tax=Hymenobacter qilianensis TaxID=1385715 RepID=A0A7H0GYI5_9BACT|nr:ComF family protein [Hymenobacter qilianensis]QNP53351.1 ComF family protein [Hymenobacter qilianensis]GGF57348.1 amidophosphoribosyltransferase [Hymenobacter qilianensis]